MTAKGVPSEWASQGQQAFFSHDYFTPLAQRLFLYFSSRISRISLA